MLRQYTHNGYNFRSLGKILKRREAIVYVFHATYIQGLLEQKVKGIALSWKKKQEFTTKKQYYHIQLAIKRKEEVSNEALYSNFSDQEKEEHINYNYKYITTFYRETLLFKTHS